VVFKSRPFVTGILLACIFPAVATAQQATGQANPAAPLEEVVVTGTHFESQNATSPAPITVLSAADLLRSGTTKAEELLISLPQANAGLTDSGVGISQTPLTGTATVDLRGVGAFRTLVLMNGRRINPGDAVNPSADLHTIPEMLIKRVEVLTGGASAVYGSDAEAGVVNFVMDTDYTGAKVTLQGSGFFDNNDRSSLHPVMRASGIDTATGGTFDGQTINMTGVYGTDFSGGTGHVELYAGYRHSAGILAASRDFSACTVQDVNNGTAYGCLLDDTTATGAFVDPAGNSYTLGAGGNTLRPYTNATDGYNFTALESLQRPDTRYTGGIFAHYNFSDHSQLYLEGQFMRDSTALQYEPSGTSPTGAGPSAYAIPCNDPLLSAAEFNTLCAANGLALSDVAQIGIGRRNIEGGPLRDSFRHASYRLVLGLKGTLSAKWTYDADVNYGKVTALEHVSNDISAARQANALNVVNVGGVPTCQSVVDGSDPSCVPYDIWKSGGVTQSALNYITEGGGNSGDAEQLVISAQAVGDLTSWGLKSPKASDGLALALGAQYRRETIRNTPDAAMAAGDLVYASNVLYGTLPTAGSFDVAEVFAELKVPLLKNMPFAETLDLDIADRFAHYHPQGNVNAYNIGIDWAPIRPVRFRSSLSRSIRAANGHELFLAQSAGLQQITDSCSGPTPTSSQTECARTGVTAAQYGHIQSATRVNVVTGGNPALLPEQADTLTAGVVLTHFDWAPSLLLSVDYWRIKINKYIGSISANESFNQCLTTGNAIFCGLIQRDPASGSLTAGRILQTRANTGSYGESGIDIAARYSMPLHSGGTLAFNFNGSALINNPITVNPAAPLEDCTGLYGQTCSGDGPTSPIPRWRHSLRTSWTGGKLDVSLNWRHIGSMNFEGTSPYFNGEAVYPIDQHVSAYDYFDLSAGYSLGRLDVNMGINNLFAKKPPIIGYGANPLLLNGNLLAGMYDSFGREVFVEFTARL